MLDRPFQGLFLRIFEGLLRIRVNVVRHLLGRLRRQDRLLKQRLALVNPIAIFPHFHGGGVVAVLGLFGEKDGTFILSAPRGLPERVVTLVLVLVRTHGVVETWIH